MADYTRSKQITVHISQDLYDDMRQQAHMHGTSMNELINIFLENGARGQRITPYDAVKALDNMAQNRGLTLKAVMRQARHEYEREE